MPIRTELNLRLPNSPGALGGVCRVLADERVDILALALDAAGHLRLVVDNHVHAAATLRERHHQVSERDVIVVQVPHAAGGSAVALRQAADAGVNVEYAYAAGGEGAPIATLVLGVAGDALHAATRAGL
jgi:hypothetical protein